jgi:O-antigen ligase
LLGAGFESFWLSPQVHERLWTLIPGLPLNEAHDGYIEIYLELGWVGLAAIALIFVTGYRRSVMAFRRSPGLGGLMIAYVLSAMIYSVTEAGFRMMHPMWIFFLLAVVEATSITAGARVVASRPLDAAAHQGRQLPAGNAVAAERSGVQAVDSFGRT